MFPQNLVKFVINTLADYGYQMFRENEKKRTSVNSPKLSIQIHYSVGQPLIGDGTTLLPPPKQGGSQNFLCSVCGFHRCTVQEYAPHPPWPCTVSVTQRSLGKMYITQTPSASCWQVNTCFIRFHQGENNWQWVNSQETTGQPGLLQITAISVGQHRGEV